MTYVYAEVDRGALDYSIVSYAERVLEEARYELDLYGRHTAAHGIRWYVRAEQADQYQLTRHGRVLDVPDSRHLSGWYLEPAWIAVRADRPLREVGLSVAHEAYHAWQDRHGKPLTESAAEHFAQRLITQLEEAP